MKEKNSFSNREWIFLIIIISITQSVIWYVSFVNAKNGTALNYVSFAGTLISIILAVLAIGYTYGESIAEKNKSNAIANQIDTLNEILKNLTIQSENFEDISKINNELQQLSNDFKKGIFNTQKKVEDIKTSLDSFIDQSAPKKDKKLSSEHITSVIQILGSIKSFSIQIPLLFLLYFEKSKSIVNKEVASTKPIFEEVNLKCQELNIKIVPDWFYYGSLGSIQSILIQSNLLIENEGTIKLEKDLVIEIKKLLSIKIEDEGKKYNDVLIETIINKINNLDI